MNSLRLFPFRLGAFSLFLGIAATFLTVANVKAQERLQPKAEQNRMPGLNGTVIKSETVPRVQMTGIVVTKDSLASVPYASIYVPNTTRGTIADWRGYFSLVVAEGDTVVFSAIGFKKGRLVVPTNLDNSKYSVLQILVEDSVLLKTVTVYPWPNRAGFKDAFVNARIPDDGSEIAAENLKQESLNAISMDMTMGSSENYKYYMQQIQARNYYLGQTNFATLGNGTVPIPATLLNPFAWAQFLKSLKKK
jgi:hypothetical protein